MGPSATVPAATGPARSATMWMHEAIAAHRCEHLERPEHVEQFEAGVQNHAEGERPIGGSVVSSRYPFNSWRVAGKIIAGDRV